MRLTRRGLLFGVSDAQVYDAPEAAKGDDISYAAPRKHPKPLVPAGAGSLEVFRTKCVGCLLCLQECRHHVLKASSNPDHLFRPSLDFRLGWCPPECSRCGTVCPTGALKVVTEKEKRAAHLGVARWNKAHCLAAKGEVCNACERHCPVKAITKDEKGCPVVNEQACIGCGACEFFCPARPATGMQVEGR